MTVFDIGRVNNFVVYYFVMCDIIFYSAAFCPFHIGQFTVTLLSLEEVVSIPFDLTSE